MPKPSAAAVRLALIASLFALVLGARWALIDRYGMDLPYWDQWDGEGLHLLAPHYEGRLTPAVLFQPHNEHRIVLTNDILFHIIVHILEPFPFSLGDSLYRYS